MTFEQGLVIAVTVLAGAVGVLFKLLLAARRDTAAELLETQKILSEERKAHLAYVQQKLDATEQREASLVSSYRAVADTARAQASGVLPPAPDVPPRGKP